MPKFGGDKKKPSNNPASQPGKMGNAGGGLMSKSSLQASLKQTMQDYLSSDKNLKELAGELSDIKVAELAEELYSAHVKELDNYKASQDQRYQKLVDAAKLRLDEIARNTRHTITIKQRNLPDVKVEGIHHKSLPLLIQLVSAGNVVLLVGPTQTAKSFNANVVADLLKLPFAVHAFGPTQTEARLMGYTTATGSYVPTELYLAVKYGKLILMDEVDTANPTVLIQMNNGISNKVWQFPRSVIGQLQDTGHNKEAKELEDTFDKKAGLVTEDGGMVNTHPDFRMIWSANTYGRGSSMEYVGRNELDASTLARLDILAWEYDDGLPVPDDTEMKDANALLLGQYNRNVALGDGGTEMRIVNSKYPGQDKWVNFVHRVRRSVMTLGYNRDVVVSPSSVYRGANNLDCGIKVEDVMEVSLFAGVDAHVRGAIAMEMTND